MNPVRLDVCDRATKLAKMQERSVDDNDVYLTFYDKEQGKLEFIGKDYHKFFEIEDTLVAHRLDGPALIWAIGYNEWWIDGQHLSEEEFRRIINEVADIPCVLRLVDDCWWVREFI